MNGQRPSSDNMRNLLEEAAKKLGTTPEILAKQLENGELNAALKNMPTANRQMISKTLADKAACKKLIESPQAQAIMRKLSGK